MQGGFSLLFESAYVDKERYLGFVAVKLTDPPVQKLKGNNDNSSSFSVLLHLFNSFVHPCRNSSRLILDFIALLLPLKLTVDFELVNKQPGHTEHLQDQHPTCTELQHTPSNHYTPLILSSTWGGFVSYITVALTWAGFIHLRKHGATIW